MQSLIAKEAEGQWSPSEAIDWSQRARVPFWMGRHTYIRLVSQFYHGERATQRLCQRLLREIDDPLALEFLRYQLADEERHEAVYGRYIESLGPIAPIDPELERALEGSLMWQGSPVGLIVAFHVVFEGGALHLLEKFSTRIRCPLFRQINARILPDEARHVAFGVKYIRENLPKLDAGERRELYAWVKGLWQSSARNMEQRHTLPIILSTSLSRDWMTTAWKRQDALLQSLGLGLLELEDAGQPVPV